MWGLHGHKHIFDFIPRNPTWAHFCLHRGNWNNPDSRYVAWAASEDPEAKVYPNITSAFLPSYRDSLSRNFQKLLEARQLLGVRRRGQTRCTLGGGGSIPALGPLSLLRSVIVLTEVEWWRGGGSRGVKPCLLCLGVLESRSRLDLIFTPSSSVLPRLPRSPPSLLPHPPLPPLFNPPLPFSLLPVSTERTRPCTPTPLTPTFVTAVSPVSRCTKCQPFIRDKQLSPSLGGVGSEEERGMT